MTRTELADAMLKGVQIEGIAESPLEFLEVRFNGNCFVCALGSALVTKFGGDYRQADIVFSKLFFNDSSTEPGERVMAKLLDIPEDLARTVSSRHFSGETIEQIAAWLKSSEQEGA